MKKKFLIITVCIYLFSCQEDSVKESTTIGTQDFLLAENLFNDVDRIVEEAFIYNGYYKTCPSYINLNKDTSNLDTLIINFGDGDPDDCLLYGKERKGRIIVTYNKNFRDSLSRISITFDSYYTNGYRLQGQRIIENKGRVNPNKYMYEIELIGASIIGNGSINIESNMTKEWLQGYNNPENLFDNIYSITGTATGNSSNGINFQWNIIEEIIMDTKCRNQNFCDLLSGKAEFTPEGFSTRSINYGDSSCNCNVEILLNENVYHIVIPN